MSSTPDRDRARTLEQVISDNKKYPIWSAWFEIRQDRIGDARNAILLVGGVTNVRTDGAPDVLLVEFNPLAAKDVVTAVLASGGILVKPMPRLPRDPAFVV